MSFFLTDQYPCTDCGQMVRVWNGDWETKVDVLPRFCVLPNGKSFPTSWDKAHPEHICPWKPKAESAGNDHLALESAVLDLCDLIRTAKNSRDSETDPVLMEAIAKLAQRIERLFAEEWKQ